MSVFGRVLREKEMIAEGFMRILALQKTALQNLWTCDRIAQLHLIETETTIIVEVCTAG